jgi:hypothetical protein
MAGGGLLGTKMGLLILDFRGNRDKAGLDVFWLRDESLEESDASGA